ncbi:GNAT family N-acetyltransferase [Promicromonospora soli]
MVSIRLAGPADLPWLGERDRHVDPDELGAVVRRERVLVVEVDGRAAGWLRWGKFWDEIPFMNMLFVDSQERGRGTGRRLVRHWETAMHQAGHTQVLTSTLADESAQHFYRRLGYVDCGGLLLPGEATEILLRKDLLASDG